MICYLSGILNSKSASVNSVIIDVNGIGYEIFIPFFIFTKLPEIGRLVKMYVVESITGMYGGITSLYGFLTKEEKEMYLLIKNEVPGIGAKKAIDYIDKISKSFTDFKTAIISKNPSILIEMFGFTKKTADKLIVALKDKMFVMDNISGDEKYTNIKMLKNKIVSEAVESLVVLGYKEQQAKVAVNKVYEYDENITLEYLIKKSLQYL
jgi:Holliday junction DNA helicase RuvA